jgi:hypothetical protein
MEVKLAQLEALVTTMATQVKSNAYGSRKIIKMADQWLNYRVAYIAKMVMHNVGVVLIKMGFNMSIPTPQGFVGLWCSIINVGQGRC